MRPGLATLLATRTGRLDVIAWHGGPRPGGDVLLARQNLPLIVQNGRPNPRLSGGPEWGTTVGNSTLVWRSGVGVDRRGDLIYAAANYRTVRGLADILIHAGAVRAMELDINSYWVTLNIYRGPGAGSASKALPEMSRPATRYLQPDDRDFFAVYAR
jgi:Phosphodiester glycosidase